MQTEGKVFAILLRAAKTTLSPIKVVRSFLTGTREQQKKCERNVKKVHSKQTESMRCYIHSLS